jgi:hypothetical protein
MRRVLGGVLVVAVSLCAAIFLSPASAGRVSSGPSSAVRTIEPTLPLVLDLHLEGVERRTGGGAARLIADLDAGAAIDDVTLSLVLPPGAEAPDDPWLGSPPRRFAAGERRHYVIPVKTRGGGPQPIAIVGSYRLSDGRVLMVRQGVTLRTDPATRFERDHLGAHEMMAVPQGDLPR